MVRLIAYLTSPRAENDGCQDFSSSPRYRPACRLGKSCTVLVAAIALCLAARAASAQTFANRILSVDVSEVGAAEEREVAEAVKKVRNKDIAGALESLKRAREKNRTIAPPNVLLARIWFTAGQTAQGRGALERAVKENPTDPEPYLTFGQIAIVEGRATDAELLFQKTISLTASFKGNAKRKKRFLIGSYSGLAGIAERREQWAVAEKHLQNWIKEDSDTGKSHLRLGVAMFRQDKFNEAYIALKNAKNVDGDLAAAEVVMSKLYSQEDDDVNAQVWLKKALTNNPNDTSTRLAVVRRLLETGKAEEASVEAYAVYKADTNSLEAKIWRGIASRMLGKHENAESWLIEAHRQAPVNFTATNHLILALVAQKVEAKRKLAMQYAQINAKLFPFQSKRPTRDGLESTVTLAWVFYATGKTKEATQILNAVLPQIGQSPAGSYYVARVLFDIGKTKEAGQVLEAALKTKRLFVERKAAEKLLKRINGAAGDESVPGK